MNKSHLLLPLFAFLIACETETIEPEPKEPETIDYRLKYVGDYAYTIDYWSYNAGAYPDPMYRDTTWYYSGTISLVDDSLKNRVLVTWGDGELPAYMMPHLTQSNRMIVDTTGVLSYPEYCRTVHQMFNDAFIRNDTIRFELTDGGAGSAKRWTVTGVKED